MAVNGNGFSTLEASLVTRAHQAVEAAQQAGMRAEFVATPEEAGDWLAQDTRDGDAVLLKASRGVKLERALEAWKARAKLD